jgi:hypothetical protein
MRETTVADIRKAIEGLPDDQRVFGEDEQSDFHSAFVSFNTRLARPKFLEKGSVHYYKDLLNPSFDKVQIERARENGEELVEILTISISR